MGAGSASSKISLCPALAPPPGSGQRNAGWKPKEQGRVTSPRFSTWADIVSVAPSIA